MEIELPEEKTESEKELYRGNVDPIDQLPEQEPETNYAPLSSGEGPTAKTFNDMLMEGSVSVMIDQDIKTYAANRQEAKLHPLVDSEMEREEGFYQARRKALKEFEERESPSYLDSSVSMLRSENWISSAMARTDVPNVQPLEGYDPLRDPQIQGYENYAHVLYDSTHPDITQAMISNISQENYNRDVISRTSLPVNLLTGVIAGMGDLLTLAALVAPQLKAVQGAKIAQTIAGSNVKTFAYGAGLGATVAGMQEVLLHSTQDTRTLEESAVNVMANIVLDSSLGLMTAGIMAGKIKATPEFKVAQKETSEYLASGGNVDLTDPFDMPIGESAGAMRAGTEETVDLVKPKGMFRNALGEVAFALAKATPLGRTMQSSSPDVRNVVTDLAETNYLTTNTQGKVSVETLTKVDYSRTHATELEVGEIEVQAMKDYGMSKEDFNAELDHAQRNGDSSPDYPLIDKAAKRLRKTTDELWNRAAQQRISGTYKETKAIDADGKETVTVEPLDTTTAQSYQTRVYDLPKIDGQYDEFIDAVKLGAADSRNTAIAKANIKHGEFIEATAPKTKDLETFVQNARKERETLQKLHENGQTAIKGNSREIGRRKGVDPNDPEIAKLEKRITEIEKKNRKVKANINKASREIKAKMAELSKLSAKGKELKGKVLKPLESHELDAYAYSYYEGVAGLKQGDVHATAGAKPDILKSRIDIKDEYLEPFLEKKWDARLKQSTMSLSGRTRMAEKFGNGTGDFEMQAPIKQIRDDFAVRIQDAAQELSNLTDPKAIKAKQKELKKLRGEMNSTIKDIEVMRDRILVRSNQDRNSAIQSFGRGILNFNSTRLLNGMVLSSIPEPSKIAAKYGMAKFNKALMAQAKSTNINKLPTDHAARMASATFRAQGARGAQMTDLYDLTPTSAFESGTKRLADLTYRFSGQKGFDGFFKSIAGLLSGDGFARAVNTGDVAMLRKSGFNDAQIDVISREIKKHAVETDGLIDPKIELWNLRQDVASDGYRPQDLMDTYDAMIIKEADTLIVAPAAGDRPIFMDSLTGRMIFQFKTFIMGATNRTLVPLAQGTNANLVKHLALMNGTAMMGYVAYKVASGQEVEWDNPEKMIAEMLSRGGYMGYAMELLQMAEKMTGVPSKALPFLNANTSRYQSRNDLGALLGPTFGTVGEVMKAVSMKTDKETGEYLTDIDSRIHAARKLLPFQNHFMIRQAIDSLEGKAAKSMGGTGRYNDKDRGQAIQ
jgi:hypothetical protein